MCVKPAQNIVAVILPFTTLLSVTTDSCSREAIQHLLLPPRREIHHILPQPGLLCSKHHGVATDDLLERAPDVLPLSVLDLRAVVFDPVDREDELPRQPAVAAAVPAGLDVRAVHLPAARPEVLNRDGIAVRVDLAVRAVDVRVPLADPLRVRYHVEDCHLGSASRQRLLRVGALA